MILRSMKHVRLMTRSRSMSTNGSHRDRIPLLWSSSSSSAGTCRSMYSGDSTARRPSVMATSFSVEVLRPMQLFSWCFASGQPCAFMSLEKAILKDVKIAFLIVYFSFTC
ncbi:hypothetical protein Cni_G11352 [Canna indica]|uniref:Uncharacterized protein n=1 Tax=Canna indica TaxID=4628 RepID=A0AAQ3K8J6_9LILI|nr:hypothetical protein Cni_G11352 [Canna indica]